MIEIVIEREYMEHYPNQCALWFYRVKPELIEQGVEPLGSLGLTGIEAGMLTFRDAVDGLHVTWTLDVPEQQVVRVLVDKLSVDRYRAAYDWPNDGSFWTIPRQFIPHPMTLLARGLQDRGVKITSAMVPMAATGSIRVYESGEGDLVGEWSES